MSGFTHELQQSFAHPSRNWRSLVGRIGEVIHGAMARRHTRRVVAGLSDAQRRDSGIDPALVLGNRPAIEVDARLATTLASFR